jgi:RecJ-like exonuclease
MNNLNKCPKCDGSGVYRNLGACFRCGGTGGFSKKTTKGPKYKIGDKIQHNTTKRIFRVREIDARGYSMDTFYKGEGFIDAKTKLGRHIDNYPEGSLDGYTILRQEEPAGEIGKPIIDMAGHELLTLYKDLLKAGKDEEAEEIHDELLYRLENRE